MNNFNLYYAIFWAFGLILMGLFIRFYLRKKRESYYRDKFGNGLLIVFFLFTFTQNNLSASEITVETSALNLLHPSRVSTEIIHPSAWIRDVYRYGHLLPDELQIELIQNGYRIASSFNNSLVSTRSESEGLDQYIDINIFRIHYTTQGSNGVDITDFNQNDIPDYIDSVMIVFEEVYQHEIDYLGYVLPPSDGNHPQSLDNGGSEHYDVYITSLSYGTYGYVQADREIGDNPNSTIIETNAYSSYMVIRNNYENFPNTEINNLRVTVAHEFFHSIQFGYDAWEEDWLMEATSVWMEESVYDDINDCYQYMISWFES
ncbi:MAG: hypothetical protein HQ509_08385, partial [Candidatus Marinimicrobia bacterium]|nr:hypothetical protein [Candidatus Neomarinimicrobiota bacterium]